METQIKYCTIARNDTRCGYCITTREHAEQDQACSLTEKNFNCYLRQPEHQCRDCQDGYPYLPVE